MWQKKSFSSLVNLQSKLDQKLMNTLIRNDGPEILNGNRGAPNPELTMKYLITSCQTIPIANSVVVVPNNIKNAVEYQMFLDMETVNAYLGALTSYYLARKGIVYDLTKGKDVARFTRAYTDERVKCCRWWGGVLKYLKKDSGDFETNTIADATLHTKLLNRLFSSFGFQKTTMDQLDRILTNIVDTLSKLSINFETQEASTNHVISLYYFKNNQPIVYVFYLEFNQKSWTTSITSGKSTETLNQFTFKMSYSNYEYLAYNHPEILPKRDSYKSLISHMTNQDYEVVRAITRPDGITG